MKVFTRSAFVIVLVLAGVSLFAGQAMADGRFDGTSIVTQVKDESKSTGLQSSMKILVIANSKTTVFELNNSRAASDLYAQLPLSIKVEDYGDNEKIFYPPKKLNTTKTPQADARAGTLAYYAPWGNVVMFYGNFGSASGLYELGHVVSGSEYLKEMTGTVQLERASSP